jgi:uncharacterized protein
MSDKILKHGEFCWNELMTGDTSKAASFYTSLFGWQANEMDMGDATYTMFKSGDADIAGMLKIPQGQEGTIPPHWMSYIAVDDVDATLAQAQELGASVAVPVTPVGDFGRFAVVADPTGAHIAFWQKTA